MFSCLTTSIIKLSYRHLHRFTRVIRSVYYRDVIGSPKCNDLFTRVKRWRYW